MKLRSSIYFYLLVVVISGINAKGQDIADNSVLGTGTWYTVKTSGNKPVMISYNTLHEKGLPEGTVPAIYGNNTGLLSFRNSDPYPDDLLPIPVYAVKGSDNIFNQGDYVVFFAEDTHRWSYSKNEGYTYKRHFYSDSACYFITWSYPAMEMDNREPVTEATRVSTYSDFLYIHEIEKTNILKSGREWYEPVPSLESMNILESFSKHTFEQGKNIKYKIRLLARSEDLTSFRLSNEDFLLSSINIPSVSLSDYTGTYAQQETDTGSINPSLINGTFNLTYFNNGNSSAKAWLDYFILHTREELIYNDEPLIIMDETGYSPGEITEYRIKNSHAGLIVWDITNGMHPLEVFSHYDSGILSFSSPGDTLYRYVVFDPANADKISLNNHSLENQDLHSEPAHESLIIAHEIFMPQAVKLADLHQLYDNIGSVIVTPQQIYNEFSGGIPDISAIRNYIRMVYNKGLQGGEKLKYVTLFGDGSVDNKTLPPANPNYIPTYQTKNSNVNILSFTSDDYYGLLDENEGETTGFLDIGIGRLPVSDTAEANIIIRKIENYLSDKNTGPWRNMILMIADDEDSNSHLTDAENLASLIREEYPPINIDKVYFDSYQQVSGINGETYPDATIAINDRIKNGCLIFNYLGHGNELGLAHERVIKTSDILGWSNINKLPVFITATCEFSRFDDIAINQGTGTVEEKTSAGEMVLLSENGGGIALLTTTRIVYAAPNYTLNNRFYKYAFRPDEQGKGMRLGDIIRLAKNDSGTGDNKRNFTLLGDPALRMAYPWHGKVVTDSINGISIESFNDTLKALSKINISGHLSDHSGNIMDSENGYLHTSLFDKEYSVSTLGNDGGSPAEYNKQDKTLFRGVSEIRDGYFDIEILIPRDIDYSFESGRLSLYAYSGQADYAGYNEDFIIGGFDNHARTDSTGPEIMLYLNDTLFRNGNICDESPVLYALLSDPGGINTSGTGIGHDIVSVIDNNETDPLILNNFYENILNSYSSGKIIYPLGNLQEGRHTLSLKAWDNYNNSSEEHIFFFVRSGKDFILNRLINYPNPFREQTRITLNHNRPGETLDIDIRIYTTGGKSVTRIRSIQEPTGYNLNPIVWDGTNMEGRKVNRGIYYYNVSITTRSGERSTATGRLLIL